MLAGAARRLTDRQRAVMERIDRRVPIKVIAQELGVSETRINQHIRMLKDVYSAASLGELVENYRAAIVSTALPLTPAKPISFISAEMLQHPYSEAAYRKNQINAADDFGDFGQRDDPGQLIMSDAVPLIEQAPWLHPGEPRVVPGVLDGENAVLFRLGAILAIASGILAAIVLTVTAAMALSEVTQGNVAIPMTTTNGSG